MNRKQKLRRTKKNSKKIQKHRKNIKYRNKSHTKKKSRISSYNRAGFGRRARRRSLRGGAASALSVQKTRDDAAARFVGRREHAPLASWQSALSRSDVQKYPEITGSYDFGDPWDRGGDAAVASAARVERMHSILPRLSLVDYSPDMSKVISKKLEEDGFLKASVTHNYNPDIENDNTDIELNKGDIMLIMDEVDGWAFGVNQNDTSKYGFFPSQFLETV